VVVHESRCHDQTGGIELDPPAAASDAVAGDAGDAIGGDSDVGAESRGAGAIHDRPAAEDDVELLLDRGSKQQEVQNHGHNVVKV
jgi:hypothetical protein